jgi:hypothetical protein
MIDSSEVGGKNEPGFRLKVRVVGSGPWFASGNSYTWLGQGAPGRVSQAYSTEAGVRPSDAGLGHQRSHRGELAERRRSAAAVRGRLAGGLTGSVFAIRHNES